MVLLPAIAPRTAKLAGRQFLQRGHWELRDLSLGGKILNKGTLFAFALHYFGQISWVGLGRGQSSWMRITLQQGVDRESLDNCILLDYEWVIQP